MAFFPGCFWTLVLPVAAFRCLPSGGCHGSERWMATDCKERNVQKKPKSFHVFLVSFRKKVYRKYNTFL